MNDNDEDCGMGTSGKMRLIEAYYPPKGKSLEFLVLPLPVFSASYTRSLFASKPSAFRFIAKT